MLLGVGIGVGVGLLVGVGGGGGVGVGVAIISFAVFLAAVTHPVDRTIAVIRAINAHAIMKYLNTP